LPVRTGDPPWREAKVSILWIILIVVVVLALLGFVGRGMW
jgi:flagellar basal body-associated protein FliL